MLLQTAPTYDLHFTFSPHTKPVGFVSFSISGELLATGDDSGQVYIWTIASGKCYQALRCSAEAISCCWGDDHELFVGCGDGHIHFFEHSAAQNRFVRNQRVAVSDSDSNVNALSLHGNRLACCTGASVHVLTVASPSLRALQSWTVEKVREMRTVHFLDRNIALAASLREGVCLLFDITEPERPLWRRKLPHRIGESALSRDNRLFAVTDLAGAVQLYEVTPTGLQAFRSFSSPVEMSSNYPVQICFAEAQSLVVSGSGAGEVRIWDIHGGTKTKLLHSPKRLGEHEKEEEFRLTQAVAAHSSPAYHLIASACADGARHTVKVWRRPNQGLNPFRRDLEELHLMSGTGGHVLAVIVFIAIAALAFAAHPWLSTHVPLASAALRGLNYYSNGLGANPAIDNDAGAPLRRSESHVVTNDAVDSHSGTHGEVFSVQPLEESAS